MDELNKIILKFEAFAKRGDGSVVPFSLDVWSPVDRTQGDSSCRVDCAFLREKPFQIFGVDGEQACELAIDFIRLSLIDRAELIDANGHPISLPVIEWPPSD